MILVKPYGIHTMVTAVDNVRSVWFSRNIRLRFSTFYWDNYSMNDLYIPHRYPFKEELDLR